MNSPSLDDIRLFVAVVQAGSLTGASELTGVPISRLSRRLTELESTLGTQLLNRGKKGVSLNELGENFFGHAQEMLKHADIAISSIHHSLEQPTGLLRLSLPIDLAPYISAHLHDYLAQHPDVQLQISLSQQKINMIQDGIDIAVRAGTIDNENVVARHLFDSCLGVYATRAYLDNFGTPLTPHDLYQHRLIAQSLTLPWHFKHRTKYDELITITPSPYVSCNDFTLSADLVTQGVGIGVLSSFSAAHPPSLVPLLLEWQLPCTPISVIYYKNRGASPAVRSFVAWLQELYQDK